MKGTVGHFSLLPGDCPPPSYSQVKFLLLLLSPAAKVLPSCFWPLACPPAILSSCSEHGRPEDIYSACGVPSSVGTGCSWLAQEGSHGVTP